MRTRILSFCASLLLSQMNSICQMCQMSHLLNMHIFCYVFLVVFILYLFYTLQHHHQKKSRTTKHEILSARCHLLLRFRHSHAAACGQRCSSGVQQQPEAKVSHGVDTEVETHTTAVTSTTLGRRENTWILLIHREFT